MFWIVKRDRQDSLRPWWNLGTADPFETHEEANDWVLRQIKIDEEDAELGRWEYIVAKVWTTYKAYGA